MKRPWVFGVLVLFVATVAGCTDEEAGDRTLTAFAYSLPADVADVAYEISVFPDGLISRIIRYDSTDGTKTPEPELLRNGTFVRTDEYVVIRSDDVVSLQRVYPDAILKSEVRFTGTNTDEITPFFQSLGPTDVKIAFDGDNVANLRLDDRVINEFSSDNNVTTLRKPNVMYQYEYSGGRLVQFTFTGLVSGTEWKAILESPCADRYTLIEPARGDPVPYLQKFDLFGEVTSASLRMIVLNFYLLFALDDGDRSYLLAFFAAP